MKYGYFKWYVENAWKDFSKMTVMTIDEPIIAFYLSFVS